MIRPFTGKPVDPYYPTVIDIETDDVNVIGVGFGWFDGYERFESFDEWIEFYAYLYTEQTDKTKRSSLRKIYAHNGAGFDWLFFIEWARQSSKLNGMEFFASESFPIGANIKIEGHPHVIRLRDSYRLLPQSLANLTKTFPVEHTKIDITELVPELNGMHPKDRYAYLKRTNPTLFWEYLEYDVKGLQQVIYSFWEMIHNLDGNLGELPMTLPSLAMRLWSKEIETPIKTTWNPWVKQLERDAYVGGRTECYYAGETNVNTYDINSLYPAVMLSGLYPTSYRGCETDHYDGKHGIYECSFAQTNRTAKPVLRDTESGYYRYDGRGTFCQPELELFLRIGGEFTVHRGWIYESIGNPFTSFIGKWWGRRARAQDTNDEAFAYVAKILMNSLYGKFGQREEHQTIRYLTNDEIEKRIKNDTIGAPIGPYWIVPEHEQHDYVFVGIAAYVTSYARVRLYERINDAEQAGGTVWYCDTDSVHVSGAMMETSRELGALKLEYEGDACYAGRKLYALKEPQKIKAKGAKAKNANGIQLLTYDDILLIANSVDTSVNVEYESLPTYREVFSGTVPVGHSTKRQRTLKQTVSKGG